MEVPISPLHWHTEENTTKYPEMMNRKWTILLYTVGT